MKNPALSADLENPSYKAKDTMDLLVHRARTTMRPKRPRGRKKYIIPGLFKQAFQSLQRDQREAQAQAIEAAKTEEAKLAKESEGHDT